MINATAKTHLSRRILGCVLAIGSVISYRAVLAPSAISAPAQTPTRLGVPFQVGFKQSTLIPAQKLKLTFSRILEDSRCPSNVECVWAGQITIVVDVEQAGRRLGSCTLTVQAYDSIIAKSTQKVGPYWVQLQRVDPYPVHPPKKLPVRATLLVSNRPIPTPTPYRAPTPRPISKRQGA